MSIYVLQAPTLDGQWMEIAVHNPSEPLTLQERMLRCYSFIALWLNLHSYRVTHPYSPRQRASQSQTPGPDPPRQELHQTTSNLAFFHQPSLGERNQPMPSHLDEVDLSWLLSIPDPRATDVPDMDATAQEHWYVCFTTYEVLSVISDSRL